VLEEIFVRKRALALWQEGQRLQLEGDLDEAILLYTQSIEVCPTAEAHTFLGWAYSFKNRLDDAIDECKKAIAVDPSLGNPYNDIGSYLIAQGKGDEAVDWLQKAKDATRYEARHFPYMNLGRLFAGRGLTDRAIEEFEHALHLCPGEATCVAALTYLRRRIN
jgi:tetratricopeptide (TPR) repeat protein